MIISLTGFMGCGKSSVGRRLSELLCCPFIDLDSVIEERAGCSIPEIFAADGEAAFRTMELDTLKHVVCEGESKTKSLTDHEQQQTAHIVLSLGGGTVMTKECADLVRQNTRCIYLRASVDTLIEHLEGQTCNRPILNSADCHSDRDSICHSDRAKRVEESALLNRIEELMSLRADTYEATAHIILDTDGQSIDSLAQEIISILK
ncbi:MAG: shikimate kinase [Bacteroidales bacterium]|nr:shikimate kinase [Bacteroidales bacterium]